MKHLASTRSPDEYAALIERLRDFIDQEVIPREDLSAVHDSEKVRRTAAELRVLAQAQGLGAPRGRREDGGMALSWTECCAYLEQAGRSFLGPMTLSCAPPTQPDMFALEQLATPAQRERYLLPLMRGERASCFAMTEPAPGVGSDPRMLSTTAERTPDGWVLNGHKWFISGAMRADFAIVVARTNAGPSWFLVDMDTPGFQVVRDIPTMEAFDIGGHAEIEIKDCRVPHHAVIGEEGKGLAHSQLRLEGARLFHCMRYIGLASRAMSTAQDYALQRESQGVKLADHQMVQAMVADAHIQLYAARQIVLDVARRLDAGESIRHHSSMAKVFVSEAVYQVADSAVQICGALGVSEDVPLSMILRSLRPFRIYDGASEVHRAAIARRALHHGLNA